MPEPPQTFDRHPQAIVETTQIGPGAWVGPFVHVLPGARIGAAARICDHALIENDVVIGDRVTIQSGARISDAVTLEDDVTIGPNAAFLKDPLPDARHPPVSQRRTVIHQGASVGANATILPGVAVGRCAVVGAGAVVTRDVPDKAIVMGNPARITGYVDTPVQSAAATLFSQDTVHHSRIPGVAVYRTPYIDDLRGALTFGEVHRPVPFEIRRYFLVYDVANREIRGEHAHRTLHQFLICTHGSCHIIVDNGSLREEYRLDDPTLGLYMPPMIWGVQCKFSADAVLLVLASAPYDPADYIRDYAEFLRLVAPAP